MTDTPLISVNNLSVHFSIGGPLFGPKKFVRAVDNVSIDIAAGTFFGLVGESGSGKTTLGRLTGSVRQIIQAPEHPYTKGLLNALPDLDDLGAPLTPVAGDIPSPLERPPGCVFHTRCPQVIEGRCDAALPEVTDLGAGHGVSCFAVPPPVETSV